MSLIQKKLKLKRKNNRLAKSWYQKVSSKKVLLESVSIVRLEKFNYSNRI